jgi:hypothetical protein
VPVVVDADAPVPVLADGDGNGDSDGGGCADKESDTRAPALDEAKKGKQERKVRQVKRTGML